MFQIVFLQNTTQGGGSPLMSLVFMVGIFAVFYFLMIRPQQRKQKEQIKFRDSVKKGDKIVTIGGIHGKIVEIQKETITLEIDKGVRITLERSAISMEGTKRYTNENAKNEQKVTTELSEN
jgi:preprotein translocase subunit YajC